MGVRASVTDAVRQVDAVIHAALARGAEIPEVDTAGTDAILGALLGTNKKVIYTSGVWVLGNTGPSAVDEQHDLPDPINLVRWRPSVEARVIAAAQEGIRTAVVRPGIVYGRGEGVIGQLMRVARRTGLARYVGSGENHWATVHIDDLADLYARVLETSISGMVFHGVREPSVRMREIFLAVAAASGRNTRVESWPLEDARRELGPIADAMALDQQVSASRARRLLEWQPCASSVIHDIEQGGYLAHEPAADWTSAAQTVMNPAASTLPESAAAIPGSSNL